MLPPEKLHENPLFSLSTGLMDKPCIPAHMVQELGLRLCGMYQAWGYRYGKGEFPKPDFSGLEIRIETKRAASAPKRTKKAVALERLTAANADVSYRHNQIKDRIEILLASASRMQRAAETLQIDNTLTSVINNVSDAVNALRAELDRVAMEGAAQEEV
jgi:hypothetical protein